jgi:peptidoglycan hydrolase-like protein with peptidoglycan-binding domain
MSSILVVQRGHVPRTSGATGAPGEQAMAIRNAAEILAIAKDLPDVTPRVIDADEPNARYAGDRFISLHGDASADASAGGASVGYRNDQGHELAQRWKRLYAQAGWPFAFRRDNYTPNLQYYYGTGHAVSAGNAQAIIVEHGFMTNPAEREFIDSDQGVKVAAAAAIAAAYPHLDLDRLLGNAPEPEPAPEPKPEPPPSSTRPSETVITYGDRGEAVKSWQRDLIEAGFAIPAGATGNFLSQTRDATNRFFRAVGLSASDPKRPVVGARSYAAMRTYLEQRRKRPSEAEFAGRYVIANVDVNFYANSGTPGWAPQVRPHPAAPLKAGWGFKGGVHAVVEVPASRGGGTQYVVSNSSGHRFRITTNPRFVRMGRK